MSNSRCLAGIILGLALIADAAEPVSDLGQILEQIKHLRETQQHLQKVIAEQQKTIEALQKQVTASAEKAGSEPASTVPAEGPVASGPQLSVRTPLVGQGSGGPFRLGGGRAYMEISFNVLAAAAWTSEPDEVTERLEFGHHDPHERGFTLQNAELAFQGVVDPYFRGDAFVAMTIDRGETILELEEAYLTTLQMPWNLQVKAGEFFTEFGRLGSSKPHPHTWDFADQPVVWGRMFGPDGLRNPGARVSWLAPTPFFLELFGGIQNPEGETAFSFLNESGETFAGRTLTDRSVRHMGDMLYTARANAVWDLTPTQTLSLGSSAAFGPNSTGGNTSTIIYGADVYWKWMPAQTDHGWPFVKWTTEVLARNYEAAAGFEPPLGLVIGPRDETLRDWGLYSEAAWGFRRPWVAGLRLDYAKGSDPADPLRDRRWRLSPNVTYYFSEFSKLRLQYNADIAEHLNDHAAQAVFLQFEYLLGSHGAHRF